MAPESGTCHTPALAGDYPDRPVKIVVPFPAGGTADAIPRIVADWLSRKWSQPVVIDNRGGGAQVIATEATAKAAPDGYTVVVGTVGTHSINGALYKKILKIKPEDEHALLQAGEPVADSERRRAGLTIDINLRRHGKNCSVRILLLSVRLRKTVSHILGRGASRLE